MVVGIADACRSDELCKMKLADINMSEKFVFLHIVMKVALFYT
jgi:hypothetical protein